MNEFEIKRAQQLADYFSVPLDILDVDYTKSDFVGFWKEIAPSLKANHLYATVNFNHMKFAQHVAKNAASSHAVFNGDISDGVHNLGFAQNATILGHPDLGFREYSDKMASYLFSPSFFKRILKGDYNDDLIYNFLRSRMPKTQFDDVVSMSQKERKENFASSFYLFQQRVPFISLKNSNMLTGHGMSDYATTMCNTYFQEFVDQVTPETLYAWMIHLYNSFHWQGATVRGRMHAADYFGLDVSMPFWDSRLHEFLSAMPESWGRGLDLNQTKYPLKWTLKNEVDYPMHLQVGPHSYLYDVDPGWSVNSDIIYGSSGNAYFKELVKDYQFEEVLKETHFNLDYIRQLADDYVNDVHVSGQQLADLKNLISLSVVGWY